jgi:hypothetical protein
MPYDRQATMPRADDGRKRTGFRLLFDRDTERDAWGLAKLTLRLSPERRRQLSKLAEEMIFDDSIEALKTDLVTPRKAGSDGRP